MVINKDYLPTMASTPPQQRGKGKGPTRSADTDKTYTSSRVSPWGKNNLEPQLMLRDAKSTPTIYSVLYWKARALYGKGVTLGAVTGTDDEGNEIIKPIRDEKVEQFLRQTHFQAQVMRACHHYPFYENLFPELILTKDRSQIYMVNFLKTPYCRWEKKDETSLLIKNLYVSGQWKGTQLPTDHAKIPAMDEYFPLESLQESGSHKMAYRYLDITEDDKEYYQVAIWNAIRTSQWLSVAQRIPEFKDKMFDNQLAIKYHIEFAREYFEWKYKGFQDMSAEERIKILKDERTAMEKTLAGIEGAGKTVSSVGHIDRQSGKYIPGVIINSLSNKFGSGDYIEDMQEATAQMLISMGVPPTLLGISPGKKFGAGSGSDIREAYNMYIAMQELDRTRILEPFYRAFEYNKYPSELRLLWRYPIITTLDKGKEKEITE
jgi:hypothetical protein